MVAVVEPITAALLTGLNSLVSRIRTKKSGLLACIHGFAKLGKEETRFVVLSSMASYVSDGALCSIFEDTRVGLRADEISAEVIGSLRWLEALDFHLWEALSRCFKAEWRVQVSLYVEKCCWQDMHLVSTPIGSASERQSSCHGPSVGGCECESRFAESVADAVPAHSEETMGTLEGGPQS